MRTVIRDCLYLDVHAGRLVEGSLVIEGTTISYVGKQPPTVHADDYVIDGKQMVALPGFVDAHTHLYQTFARGLVDDLPLTQWLERIWSYDLPDEALYYSTLLGALEAIRFGTTCISDMTEGPEVRADIAAQAIRDSGLRAVVSMMIRDYQEGENTPVRNTEEALEQSRSFVTRWNGAVEGRIRARVAPVGLPACSEALMRDARSLADTLGVGLHTHCCEGKVQTETSRDRFGRSEVQATHEFAGLTPNTQLAHTIWVDDDDIALIAESGAHVVHCPSSNMRLTDGICPVPALMHAGVNVGLGCDGAASSGSYDMVREGKTAALLAKIHTMDASVLPTEDILRMMTINGAAAVGLGEQIGSLEAGKKADIVLINRRAPHLIDDRRLLSHLTQSATGGDVDTVIIDGEILLEGGEFAGVDMDEILAKCEQWMSAITQ